MKTIFALMLLACAPCFAQQPTEYKIQTTADTVSQRASPTFLDAIIVGTAGTSDIIELYDTTATSKAGIVTAPVRCKITVSAGRTVTFGTYGMYFKNGFAYAVRGTAGSYTFIFR